MYPGLLTKAERIEYDRLSAHISRFVLYCEQVRADNKELKPQDRIEIDYTKNLSDEGYFRWNELRAKAWS